MLYICSLNNSLMTDEEKTLFNKRLSEAKKYLPYRYGTMVRAMHPELTFCVIHNVVNKGTFNMDVLTALEHVAYMQKKIKEKS